MEREKADSAAIKCSFFELTKINYTRGLLMFRSRKKSLNLIVLSLGFLSCFLAACDQERSSAQYSSTINTKQTMNWVLDPHADLIWESSGFVMTDQGVQSLAPTTDEGWDAVRNASASIVESGNLLLMPHHATGRDAWIGYARRLQATGMELLKASENRDAQALFDLGGQLYVDCQSCHNQYLVKATAGLNN